MDAERWQRLKHHLSALLELSEAERSEALAHVELDAADKKALADMLAADASGDAFERAISRGVGQAEREIGNPSRIGSMVGAYRLIGQLGEGGMGDVYLAERADGRFEGAVAVKFLAMAGSRAATMFERERQILAQLQHPGIARLIDAGEDGEGHAYVVMEYVDGSRIDQYSMAHGLDIRSRLELIAQAADVVDHAHRMFVLHRDLKPAHLLVAGGSIKVLDFGVAALADPDTGMATATQSMSYTPRYAAPEQLLGEPNCPGTDVYSLALILYELLTGEHAFGDANASASDINERKVTGGPRRIRNVGELGPQAPGPAPAPPRLADLNAVLAQSLARQPDSRYRTAADFAADLRRLVHDLPVVARRLRWQEVTWRWAMRNRLAAASVMAGLVSLVLAAVISIVAAREAIAQRNVAIEQATKAGAIADYLHSVFAAAAPWANAGREVTAVDLVHTGVRGLQARGSALPDRTEAELWNLYGDMFHTLARWDDALESFDRARSAISDPDSAVHLGAMLHEARTRSARGEADAAIAIYRAVLLHEPRLGLTPETVQARFRLARRLAVEGSIEEMQALLAPLLQREAEIAALEKGEWLLAEVKTALGIVSGHEPNGVARRVALDTQALEHYVRFWGTELHPDVANLMDSLAYSHRALGDRELASELDHRALAIMEAIYESNHPNLLVVRMNRALSSEIPEQALQLSLAVLREIQQDQRAPRYQWEGLAWFALGRAHEDRMDFSSAIAPLVKSAELVAERLGTENYRYGQSLAALGRVQWKNGEHDLAQATFDRAVASLRQAVGPDHPKAIQTEVDRFVFHADTGRIEQARANWNDLRARAASISASEPAVLAQLLAVTPFEDAQRAQAIDLLGAHAGPAAYVRRIALVRWAVSDPRLDPAAGQGGASSSDPRSTDPHSTDPHSTDPRSTDPRSPDPSSTDPSSIDPGSIDH